MNNMEKFTASALCTREDYMAFRSAGKIRPLPIVCGAVLIAVAAAGLIFKLFDINTALLPLVAGLALLLYDPLFLPVYRKGEAAREYDTSGMLNKAVTLTFEGDSVFVDSVNLTGTLPLSLATVTQQANVISLRFGPEPEILIPLHALTEQQANTLLS